MLVTYLDNCSLGSSCQPIGGEQGSEQGGLPLGVLAGLSQSHGSCHQQVPFSGRTEGLSAAPGGGAHLGYWVALEAGLANQQVGQLL